MAIGVMFRRAREQEGSWLTLTPTPTAAPAANPDHSVELSLLARPESYRCVYRLFDFVHHGVLETNKRQKNRWCNERKQHRIMDTI